MGVQNLMMQRALIILGLASCCMARGFRPRKHLDRDKHGLEHHSDLRIIGGSKAPVGKFPWMVMLGGSLPRCGGAAIAENWILTAAHCVLNGPETAIIPASPSQKVFFGCEKIGDSRCQTAT